MRSLDKDSDDPRYHAALTAVMIDWSSAVVKPKGSYLELAVRLSTAPRRRVEERVRAHQPHDRRPRVRALVGERPGLRRAHPRKERDEIAYARQQAVKAQEESAKQMTERFRSAG